MKYKDFKGLKLSRLGMGNMRLPETDGKIDYDKAEAIIDLAMRGASIIMTQLMYIIMVLQNHFQAKF